jgi:hypothetical protein
MPVGVAAGLVLLLAGCADTRTAVPAVPGATAAAPSASSARGRSPVESSVLPAARDTSGPSFGVDRVSWPATAEGAARLFNALPQTFRGEKLEVYYQPADSAEESGASAGALYGEKQSITVFDEHVTTDTESGKPELFTADQLLAASFGLVFGCAERSYRGTIEPVEGGSGPGFGPSKPSSRPAWFSCRIDGAEGNENFKGYAVGWTSDKAAWLVIAEDEKAARFIIAGLEMPAK